MSDMNNLNSGELTVSRRDGAPAAQRITEAEFRTRSSEWLREASGGCQIIVVDETDHEKVKMVIGTNGVVFKVADPASETRHRVPSPIRVPWRSLKSSSDVQVLGAGISTAICVSVTAR